MAEIADSAAWAIARDHRVTIARSFCDNLRGEFGAHLVTIAARYARAALARRVKRNEPVAPPTRRPAAGLATVLITCDRANA